MKKPVVDREKCIGCGTCVALAGKTFKLGADGKSEVLEPVGDDEKTIQGAVEACPVQAISLKE